MEAQERPGVVTFKGSPMTLEGPELNVGDAVPDVETVGANRAPVLPLAASAGKRACSSLSRPWARASARLKPERSAGARPNWAMT